MSLDTLVEQAGKFVHLKLEADLSKAQVVEGEQVWCEDTIYETPIIPMTETECIFAASKFETPVRRQMRRKKT